MGFESERLLVVSAHAADFVWRAGGVIASYLEKGAKVNVICLSLGVRGESNDLWKKEGQTYESVAATREGESRAAAAELGLTEDMIEYWYKTDYPITITDEDRDRLVKKIRDFRPTVIITHDEYDILNPDHDAVNKFVFMCSVMANSNGVRTEGQTCTKQMKVLGFEPHQTEISHYKPDVIVDITSVYEKKARAMECFKAQSHLIEYYKNRCSLRGNHARRISGCNDYKYAESFSSHFPFVVTMI